MTEDRYTYSVRWSALDGEYIGLCEEFPSLSHLAETREEAWAGIRELVKKVVENIRAERIKALKSIEDSIDAHMSAIRAVDEISLPGRSGKVLPDEYPDAGADPSVPHGYPSFKDYAAALKAELEKSKAYTEKLIRELNGAWDELNTVTEDYNHLSEQYAQATQVDQGVLTARIKNQRHELRQCNRKLREQKLEIEVLKGRNRQQEKTLRVALGGEQQAVKTTPSCPVQGAHMVVLERFDEGSGIGSGPQPGDRVIVNKWWKCADDDSPPWYNIWPAGHDDMGYTMRVALVNHNPACDNPGGKH